MSSIKISKIFFHFLPNVFVKISGVIGVILIIVGSFGLFFGRQPDNKALRFLICALVGYLMLVAVSLSGLETMNQKEIKSSRPLKGEEYTKRNRP